MKHKPINEQVIVITGASSGIGLCTALLAAERGARVVLVARSRQTLDDIVEVLGEDGHQAQAIALDVADREQVDQAVREVLQQHGRIDTWVNNAAVSIYGRLDQVEERDSRRLFDTNFWGMVNGSLAALPALRESGGVLVNLGSEASEVALPLQGMYVASKHAVKGFTDALRVEQELVDGERLSIVLVQPTAVDTPYPEHARNYMDHEPKLPDPQIAPQRVAEVILEAAQNGGRDIKVGAMAHINTRMSVLLPRLADRFAARQVANQQRDEAPRDPAGALFKPGGSGRIHGRRDTGSA